MNEAEKQKIITELKDFYKKLRSYQNRQLRRTKGDVSNAKDRSLNALRLELQRYHARLKDVISQYGGQAVLPYLGIEYEVFSLALSSLNMRHNDFTALDGAISLANKAIARLEVTPIVGLEAQRDKGTGTIEWTEEDVIRSFRDALTSKAEEPREQPSPPSDTPQPPIQLFDSMQFHPKVTEASMSCFVSRNYREAILNAFINLIDYIKEITGLDLDGDDLMNNVFSFSYDREQRKITKYPIICVNELKNRTDRDEQQGFMFLCKGAAAFVRNPKAHKLILQTDPLHTLEYLAFASILFKQLDKRV